MASTKTTAHYQRTLEQNMHRDTKTISILGRLDRQANQSQSLSPKIAILTAVMMLLLVPLSWGQKVDEYNIPDEVSRCVKALGSRYEISGKINPFYLRGNFHGDGKVDYAVLMRNGDQQGVMICRCAIAKPT